MQKDETLPVIVLWGRDIIAEYGIDEYTSSLKRAFIDNDADFIVLDSNIRGQKYLAACVAWAISQDILWHDGSIDDEQSTVSSFRLTEYGKSFLGCKS
jgi:hypothetical protein